MAKIAGQRSKDAGQDAKCRKILQNQGQLVSLLCTQQKSHMIKFVSLINHKLQ